MIYSNNNKLRIGGKQFNSRLMLGTGKYKTIEYTVKSIEKSIEKIFRTTFCINDPK